MISAIPSFFCQIQTKFVRIDGDDAGRMIKTAAKHGAKSCGTGPDDSHRVFRPDVTDPGAPETGGKDISGKDGLFIGYAIRDTVQPVHGIGNPDIRGLAAVDAASQCPSAVRIGAVIDKAPLTEKAFAAEGFHIDRHPVTHRKTMDLPSQCGDFSHHLMADDDPGPGFGDTAVFDVNITGTDGSESHPDDGIRGRFYLRDRARFQSKDSRFLINDSLHLFLCSIIHNTFLLSGKDAVRCILLFVFILQRTGRKIKEISADGRTNRRGIFDYVLSYGADP